MQEAELQLTKDDSSQCSEGGAKRVEVTKDSVYTVMEQEARKEVTA